MNNKTSNQLFEQAKQHIPGGVNSPVRAFKSVGGNPIFIKKAAGSYLFDEDDNKYIDCIASWGPMILGHAYPKVTAAIQEQVTKGTSYGAPTALEIKMAELIKSMVPNVDLIRMVNSGTEACMSASRVRRCGTTTSCTWLVTSVRKRSPAVLSLFFEMPSANGSKSGSRLR